MDDPGWLQELPDIATLLPEDGDGYNAAAGEVASG